jgi:hypothetical protein
MIPIGRQGQRSADDDSGVGVLAGLINSDGESQELVSRGLNYYWNLINAAVG